MSFSVQTSFLIHRDVAMCDNFLIHVKYENVMLINVLIATEIDTMMLPV